MATMILSEGAQWLSAVLVAGLMVFTRHGWIVARYGATLTHELGHTVFGMLTQAKISGIRLYADSSGGTHSNRVVRIFPFGAIISSFFGYPAPVIFGSVFLSLLLLVSPVHALWAIIGAGVLTLLFIRNLFGLLVTLTWVASSASVIFYLPEFMVWFSLWTAFLMLFGGFKDLWMLHNIYHENEGTDLHDLKYASHLPMAFWHWMMWIVSIVVALMPLMLLYFRDA